MNPPDIKTDKDPPFFFIVGNSGSGKDSILKYVQDHWSTSFPTVKIIRRYITRPEHETEPFHSVTIDQFNDMERNQQFAFSWFVYDTYYGVPNSIFDDINQGKFVFINVSRAIVKRAKTNYPSLQVIMIQVPADITKERLKNRGRENSDDPVFQERIQHGALYKNFPYVDVVISNSGELSNAGESLIKYLENFID
jgi:ribose 1,5-bisphosphokinase